MRFKLIAIIAGLLVVLPVFADWGVVGAGNATCSNWNSADQNNKKEILSWMTGFASAVNLDFASTKQPEYKLEYLTYEFLTQKIHNICGDSKNSNESMSSILFGVLKDFPRESQK